MPYEKMTTKYTNTTDREIYAQWNGPTIKNPSPENSRTAHLSVLINVYNFSTQYNTGQFW